jgi:hypothetical protein
MAITAPPTIPVITDPSTFATRAQDWVVWQAEQLYPELTSQSLLLGLSLSATSVTSNTVGTGSKSFTVETGKGFAAGQSLVIADSTTPTNRMFGVVDTYDSGTGALVFISQAFEGSGTFTAWSISPTLNAVLTLVQVPDGLLTTAKYADDSVTFTKIENITTSRILGRTTAAIGDIEQLTAGDRLTLTSGVLNATAYPVTSGFSVSASGTNVDFTSIPSWVKRITLMVSGVSTNGTSNIQIQIGDSGGIETTNYLGAESTTVGTTNAAFVSGFIIKTGILAANNYGGICTLILLDSATNTWAFSSNISTGNSTQVGVAAGVKALSATLDRVRLTTVNGTDTFDAGLVNILYE